MAERLCKLLDMLRSLTGPDMHSSGHGEKEGYLDLIGFLYVGGFLSFAFLRSSSRDLYGI